MKNMVAGAVYRFAKGKFVRIDGKVATRCTCGEGWTLCDFCFEGGKMTKAAIRDMNSWVRRKRL